MLQPEKRCYTSLPRETIGESPGLCTISYHLGSLIRVSGQPRPTLGLPQRCHSVVSTRGRRRTLNTLQSLVACIGFLELGQQHLNLIVFLSFSSVRILAGGVV